MSGSNPLAHASHANSYSHGASSTPAQPVKQRRDGARSSGASNSSSSSHSGSATSALPLGAAGASHSGATSALNSTRHHESGVGGTGVGGTHYGVAVKAGAGSGAGIEASQRRASRERDARRDSRRDSGLSGAGVHASGVPSVPDARAGALRGSEMHSAASSSGPTSASGSRRASSIAAPHSPTRRMDDGAGGDGRNGGGVMRFSVTDASKGAGATEKTEAGGKSGGTKTGTEDARPHVTGGSGSGSGMDNDVRSGSIPAYAARGPASSGSAPALSSMATTAGAVRSQGGAADPSAAAASGSKGGHIVIGASSAVTLENGATRPPSTSGSASGGGSVKAKSKSSKAEGSASTKKPAGKAVSKKKAKLISEQVALTDIAAQAAALLQEKQELEERIAARAAREAAEQAHASRVVEAGRLYTEAESDTMFEREREAVLDELEEQVARATEWDEYLACNPLPDVRTPAQLNAFVSVFREGEAPTNPPHLSLLPTLSAVSESELVVAELGRWGASAREEMKHATVEMCTAYTLLIRSLARAKLDALTCRFLTRADEYEKGEERSFTTGHAGEDIAYGLFVHNSSRAGRIKRVDFEAHGLGIVIELPQSLQKSRTAIRIVRTLYDAVSAQEGMKVLMERAEAIKGPRDPGGRGEPSAAHAAALALPSAASSRASSARPPSFTRELSSRPGTRGLEQSLSSKLLLTTLSDSTSSDESLRDPTALFDLTASFSTASSSSSTAATPPAPLSFDTHTHFVPLGGVIELQQLLLPPAAKKIKSWTLREITALDHTLVTVPYPAEDAATQQGGLGGVVGAPAVGIVGATALAPLRIRFTLPQHIFLPEDREPLFGYWDASHRVGPGVVGAWRQDGVSILEFEPRSRAVSLSLPTIKPFAVIQPRALDFPYRSWSILPVPARRAGGASGGPDDVDEDEDTDSDIAAHSCRLEVTGSRFSVCLEVRGLGVRLVSPAVNSPCLDQFREWSSPGELLSELAMVGINVAPTDADAHYCRKPLKAPLLVSTLHAHLSLLTQIFEVQSSTHNVSRSAHACTIRVRLNRHSVVLEQAASRRQLMDWEAAEEEAERMDLPVSDGSIRNFPASLRERDVRRDENGNEVADADASAIDAQIAAMEAEERAQAAREKAEAEAKAKAAAEEEARYVAAEAARAQSAKRKKGVEFDETPVVLEPELTQEQKYALGFEWVTVLAEQIDAPADPSLDAVAAAAAAAAARPATSSSTPHVSHSRSTPHESLPPGVLLRFTIIRADATGPDAAGTFDATPLPGCTSHVSLRRCLLAYFADKTPHDLCTAMSMAKPNFGREDGQTSAEGNATQQSHFLPFDQRTLQTQQTVGRTLNLLRPLIFC